MDDSTTTFTPSKSSVYDWLQYNGSTIPTLPNCQLNSTAVNCTQVCNNSDALFTTQSSNLVTCGIWTNFVMSFTDQYSIETLGLPKNVSLNASDIQRTSVYADTISNCFEFIYINVKRYSFADDGHVPAACTRHDLFPVNYTQTSLNDCLKEICSPLTMNPDLAGIGVFSSFIAQSCIALLALGALLGLDVWSRRKGRAARTPEFSHTNKLMIALVEFHKAQCYFSSIIQITALTLFHTSKTADKRTSETYYTANTYQDFFDTSVLIVLASSGLIPIALVLACITRYGRQSWYLLFLSWMTIILASTTLISSYYWTHVTAKDSDWYDNNLFSLFSDDNEYDARTSCDLSSDYLSDIVIPLCGNSKLLSNALPAGLIGSNLTWVTWANCIIWMLFCLGKKCYDTKRLYMFRARIRAIANNLSWARLIAHEGRAHSTWLLLAIIPWSLCFAGQFYLFSAFFDHRVISYAWSFGQIIAVFVWIPAIVELIYIELNGIVKASAYRYPSPLMVMERMASRSSISLANLASPEVRKDNASDEHVWSPEIDGDNGSATGPRGHYSLLNESRYP